MSKNIKPAVSTVKSANKSSIASTLFVSLLERDEATGKVSYNNIVYRTKNREAAAKFAIENYVRSVTTAIKTGAELIRLGVDEKKLKEFKNPVLY